MEFPAFNKSTSFDNVAKSVVLSLFDALDPFEDLADAVKPPT